MKVNVIYVTQGMKRKIEGNKRKERTTNIKKRSWTGGRVFMQVRKEKNFSMNNNNEEEKQTKEIIPLKVYDTELENVKEFNGFRDFLQTYFLKKGKMSSDGIDEETRAVGIIKAAFRVYHHKYIEEMNFLSPNGMFFSLPRPESFHLLVRVYCIRAFNLLPADSQGKADPYLTVQVGKQIQTNKKEAVKKCLEPEFGKCFEFYAHMPFDSLVTIKVWDFDYFSGNDLMGKTTIDIENRYYSQHRATCGIQEEYISKGNAKWRDSEKPTEILSTLCKEQNLPPPIYTKDSCVVDGEHFYYKGLKNATSVALKEELALCALKDIKNKVGYQLVPEHVETRTLYSEGKNKTKQGKIQLWIDMFRVDTKGAPPPVDISVRKPEEYELRVIVLNTEGIQAIDNHSILGIQSSDVFVRGWIKGMENNRQETDTHYRSASGKGMFNWRFVFPMLLLVVEERIIIERKAHFYDIDKEVTKQKLYLQLEVWDADIVLPDNFLGKLKLDLFNLKPPAKTADSCTLKGFEEQTKCKSLAECGKARGWWPFKDANNQPAGVIEAELELLSKEEAELRPVGRKRNDPEGLPKPKRPEEGMSFILGPVTIMKLIAYNHKGAIIKAIVLILLVLLVVMFFYSMPGYTVKKLLHT